MKFALLTALVAGFCLGQVFAGSSANGDAKPENGEKKEAAAIASSEKESSAKVVFTGASTSQKSDEQNENDDMQNGDANSLAC